jgi:hypothetical protein
MLLLRNSDYTTASNTNVTLTSGAAAGDIVEIVSITNLNSINAATTTTNTFTGAQTMNQTLAINTTIQGSSRLQVNYNTTAGGYPWDNSAMVIRDSRAMTSGVGGGLIFEGNYLTAGGMSAYGGIRGRKSNSTNGDPGGFLDIWSRSTGIRFFKSEQLVGSEGTPDMIIDSSGRVGIGISSPTAPLHLSTNSATDVNPSFIGNFTGAGGTDFRLVRNSTANSQSVRTFRIRGGNDFDSFTSFELGMESNHPLRFITNNIERMRITADGLVDMGAFSPNHTLTDSTARTYAANTWYTLPGTLTRPNYGGSYFLQIFIQYDEFGWHGYAGACVLGIVQWKFGGTLPTITIPLDRHAEDSINVSIRPEIGNGTATISVNFSSAITVTSGGFVQIKAKRMF